jgi:Protein of unknown function (DUF5672)
VTSTVLPPTNSSSAGASLIRPQYHLNSCTDFSSSNNALFHRSFWEDEFDDRDGDLVMIFQADSVLCYPLVVAEPLAKYAFVASVRPRARDPLVLDSLEGPCIEMPAAWHSWIRPQRLRKNGLMRSGRAGTTTTTATDEERPSSDVVGPSITAPLREDFPRVCEDGRAPMGSGGLSLRSRRWMIKAIETCPHVKYSGLDDVVDGDNEEHFFGCKVFDLVREDFYFATVLQGMGAPLPSPYTATLFSSEAFWPDQVLEEYPSLDVQGITTSKGVVEKASSDWLDASRPAISFLGTDEQMAVPNAMHRVWWYHPEEVIGSVISDNCPFLPFIHTSNMNRYDQFTQQRDEWIGIGT